MQKSVSMANKVLITDHGNGKVNILVDGKDVTDGCVYYAIEREVDSLPVLTLRYHAASVVVDGVCVFEAEAPHENA